MYCIFLYKFMYIYTYFLNYLYRKINTDSTGQFIKFVSEMFFPLKIDRGYSQDVKIYRSFLGFYQVHSIEVPLPYFQNVFVKSNFQR